MNRQERRKKKREQQRLENTIIRLTPAQTKLINKLADEKAERQLTAAIKFLEKTAFQIMRENRISKERANKIIYQIKRELVKD